MATPTESRKATILRADYSLIPIRSQREVAEIMGCTRTRVWQIEKSAFAKLRRRLGPRLGFETGDVGIEVVGVASSNAGGAVSPQK